MSSPHLVIHNKTYCSLKYLAFKFMLWPAFFFIMEDRLATKEQATIINKCNALKLKRTSNLYLVSSWRVFKRMHIKHKWGSLAKDHGNTHLIKSLKPTLDCLQPILLIYKSGRLMWSLVGKNNPRKTLYLKYCQTKWEILLDLLKLVKKAIGK